MQIAQIGGLLGVSHVYAIQQDVRAGTAQCLALTYSLPGMTTECCRVKSKGGRLQVNGQLMDTHLKMRQYMTSMTMPGIQKLTELEMRA